MTAMMTDYRKRIAADRARFQGHNRPIADISLIARNTCKFIPGAKLNLRFASARQMDECGDVMGNSQGRDNAKKRARRRKKTERLALAKAAKKKAGK